MDGAARHVKASDLARLSRLRERREDEAARQLRRLADARALAEQARADAAALVTCREADRARGERKIYDELGEGGPLGLSALDKHRRALSNLAEAVERSRQDEAARAEDLASAAIRHEEGRVEHARRAREVRQWDRARERIRTVQQRRAEEAEEFEGEDDILMRRAGRRIAP